MLRRVTGPPVWLAVWLLISGLAGGQPGSAVVAAGLIIGLGILPDALPRAAVVRLPAMAVTAGVCSGLYSLVQFCGLDLAGSPGGAGSRPFATMGNPDFVAAYLVAVFPMAAAGWLARPTLPRLGACFILAAGLLIAQSRGAWIGVAASAVAGSLLLGWSALRRGVRRAAGVLAGAALLTTLYFGFSVQARERLMQTVAIGHFDAAGRLAMWKATLGMIRDRPVVGGGLGTFGVRYPAAHASVAARRPGLAWFWSENSHDDYLQLAADTGLIGLGMFAWIWAIFVRAAWRRWRGGSPVALGLLLGFVAVQADAVFNFPWYLLPVQGWFWLAWAWLAPGRSAPAVLPTGRTTAGVGVWLVGGAALLSAALGARELEANAWLKHSGDLVAAARWPEARFCADQSLNRRLGWENPQRAANNGAIAAYSAGDFPAAAGYSRRSLAWFPDQPGALNQLGLALARMGQTEEAAAAARRALALNPRQAESWHLLGNLAYLGNDQSAAAAYWAAALRENPALPGLRESLAALQRRGKAAGTP